MIRKLFYPVGKCHPKYIQYVAWSFVSNLVVSVESAMGAHSMLAAIGSESETFRTVNYIGKDIIGQIGALGYLSNMSHRADKEPRRFMMYSHLIQQVAFVAMFTTPIAPIYFLPIAGCSNILTNISFAGFGAVNAMCIQQLATDNNIGEVYAKITMINMIGSSIGLAVGVSITILVPDHYTRLSITPFLAFIRIHSLNLAVRSLISE